MKIVLSGGGTGGHIYPALAIAEYAKQEKANMQFVYIGSENGVEKNLAINAGLPFHGIHISGFARKLSTDNIKTIWRFLQAVKRCKKLFKSIRPDVVIGTGGYVCGPVVYAAHRLGIPTLIHEQNVIPGLTNRFLERYAHCVAVSFEGSLAHFKKAKKVVHTGNPRATIVTRANAQDGRRSLKISSDRELVLIVGGSGGAKAMNDVMIAMAPELSRLPSVQFVYVTGRAYYERTVEHIQNQSNVPDNVKIVPYLENMPEVLAATRLVVGRSGATSLAEITALGVPAILIPSPNVTNNHQEANARWLSDHGAAVTLLEKDLNGSLLLDKIEKLLQDPIRMEYMSKRSLQLGCKDAAKRIYDEIIALR